MKKNLTNHMINHSVAGKNKEDLIHKCLTDMNFRVIREYPISNMVFEQKYKQRKIDMKISYGNMELFLESDGKVHGDLETPTKSTLARNRDFEKAGLDYILINHESIRILRKIMKLKNISIEQLTEFIVVYRAWEQYSKHLARGDI